VQGASAAGEIRRALVNANAYAKSRLDCDFDAVILARGGGSLEDLWAFNDESLARAIVASELPVVSGVGHEVDVTIADFAADARAPTPSAAAELLSEDQDELRTQLASVRQRLHRAAAHRLERARLNLNQLRARLRHPGDRLREQSQRLDDLERRLQQVMKQRLEQARRDQQLYSERLQTRSPLRRINLSKELMKRQEDALTAAIKQKIHTQRQTLQRREQVLNSLNPMAILDRGYSILSNENGSIIRSSEDATDQQRIHARLAKGSLELRVEHSEPGSKR